MGGIPCCSLRARMARNQQPKQVLRELVDREGVLHQVWVPVLPAAGEEGCRTPDYARKGKRRIRHRRDDWEIKKD